MKTTAPKPRKRPFESWIIDDIELVFGMERAEEMQAMDDWLSAPQHQEISPKDREQLLFLQQRTLHNIDAWNEDELKFYFLGPLMVVVDLEDKRFKSFLQRSLKAIIGDIELSGKVDFMVATGKTIPRQPYFFFHEYKRQRGRNNDPLGQLLAEMITAHALNESKNQMYGCYVEGRFWYFVVMDGKKFIVSKVFDSLGDDIFAIVAMLRQVKTYIAGFLDAAAVSAPPSGITARATR